MKFIQKSWPEVKIVGTIFLAWRIWLFGLGFLAEKLLPFKESFPYVGRLSSSWLPNWLWAWGNFDGVHYVHLAGFGYTELGLQVFFPLYPLTIKLLNFILNDLVLSGLLTSNLSIFFGAWIFYRLTLKQFDKKIALWSTLFLFAFPVSLYFGAIYTEALFFLLLITSFYFKNIFGAIAGGLASGLRLVGSFIFPSLVMENRKWAVLSLSGIIAYVTYLWIKFNNPIIFLSGQTAFANSRADSISKIILPPQVIYRYLKIFLTASATHYDFWVAVLEFLAFGFGLVVLLALTFKKKVPWSWLIFAWPAFLLPSFSGTFSSMPRYLIILFPIYVGLAFIKSLKVRLSLLILFVILLSVFTVLFTRGYWVS